MRKVVIYGGAHSSVGTGLGLHMSYKIITQLYKGMIEAENIEYYHDNQLVQGAMFTVKLPLYIENN